MQLLDFEINIENTLISEHECIWDKNGSFVPGLY